MIATFDEVFVSSEMGVRKPERAAFDAIAEAIRSYTSLVVIETPANPTLQLVDIEAVVAQAQEEPVQAVAEPAKAPGATTEPPAAEPPTEEKANEADPKDMVSSICQVPSESVF